MLSRISRMTTMSAQILGGCSLLRDGPTAPKVATKVTTSEHVFHDHSQYCKATERQRSSSSGDPFLGLGREDSQVFDEMLDLDSRKQDMPLTLASSINSIWNGELRAENDDCVAWMEHFSTIDTKESSAESDCFVTLSSDVFELASHLVDWQAWDRYLDNDECSAVKKSESNDDCVFASLVTKEESPSASGLVPNIVPPEFGYEHRVCVPSSGPLIKLPNHIKESHSKTQHFGCICSYCRISHPKDLSFHSYSGDGWGENKIVVKKRGVKMKPLVDNHTNRRRAMNRIAALRYRERKRKEQNERRREFDLLLLQNHKLHQEEKKLRAEVAHWKMELAVVRTLRDTIGY